MTQTNPPLHRLLQDWSSAQSAPALTWYGPESERVELSGRVLANWVIKAINLLQDEADAAPGIRVALDLPVHWRALVWALGAWGAGAGVLTGGGQQADILVTADPQPAPGPMVIAITLPALARSVPDLPAGAIDGAAELMAQPDVLMLPPDWDPDASALPGLSHSELGDPAQLVADLPNGHRYLVQGNELTAALRTCLAIWLAGGSVLLVGDPAADLNRLAAQEGAQRLPG